MEIIGYKGFDKNNCNRYNMLFEENQTYKVEGDMYPGKYSQAKMNGYHMCKNLVDVFRFVDAKNDNFSVAKVVGGGKTFEFEDDYNGYYEMYVCSEIYIKRFITREEIISLVLGCNEFELHKFFMTFKCTPEEILLFINKFKNNTSICRDILYYQIGMKDAYQKREITQDIEEFKRKKLVI